MDISIVPLRDGILELSGRDAVTFLQGYVTNDVRELTDDSWQPGAFCNLQGRVVTTFRMIALDGRLLLKMNRNMVAAIGQFLAKYIVFAKAQTRDATDDWMQFGLAGAEAGHLMDQLFGESHDRDRPCRLTATAAVLTIPGSPPRYEVWCAADSNELIALNAQSTRISLDEWNLAELESGWPWIAPDNSNEYLPQMLNLHAQGAVSFSKGCYLGQEIVARAQYRGQLKKRMHRYSVAGAPQSGDKVVTDTGAKVGDILCIAVAGAQHEILAIVRKDADANLRLTSGASIRELSLPYTISSEA